MQLLSQLHEILHGGLFCRYVVDLYGYLNNWFFSVNPAGPWFKSRAASPTGLTATAAVDTQASGARARAVIMEIERSLGFDPEDRELEKLGYDMESRISRTGKLRFIEKMIR